jgi:abhydrolase domain-containing protein 12
LSDPFYKSLPSPSSPLILEQNVPLALKSRPTILFFHGNAATRAVSLRVSYYKDFSSRLGANVLAIDYRGFADSRGTPSEAGLALDARAAWDWVIENGAKPEDVSLVGHSLGAGVVATLGAQLSAEKVRFRGAVLMSPFSTMRTLLDTYMLFKVLPVIRPLAMIPGASSEYFFSHLSVTQLTELKTL